MGGFDNGLGDADPQGPPRQEANDISTVLPWLHKFVTHPTTVNVNIPMLCKTAPMDFNDPLLELLPEAYIASKAYRIKAVHEAMDELAREMACGLIRYRKEEIAGVLDA